MADWSVISDILEPPCNVMYGDYVGSLYLCIHKKVNRMRITFSKFFSSHFTFLLNVCFLAFAPHM